VAPPRDDTDTTLFTLMTPLDPGVGLLAGGEDNAFDGLNFTTFLVFCTPFRNVLLLGGRKSGSGQRGICENRQCNEASITLKHDEATGVLFRWHNKKTFSGAYSLRGDTLCEGKSFWALSAQHRMECLGPILLTLSESWIRDIQTEVTDEDFFLRCHRRTISMDKLRLV
jgi:hypothetical protein